MPRVILIKKQKPGFGKFHVPKKHSNEHEKTIRSYLSTCKARGIKIVCADTDLLTFSISKQFAEKAYIPNRRKIIPEIIKLYKSLLALNPGITSPNCLQVFRMDRDKKNPFLRFGIEYEDQNTIKLYSNRKDKTGYHPVLKTFSIK